MKEFDEDQLVRNSSEVIEGLDSPAKAIQKLPSFNDSLNDRSPSLLPKSPFNIFNT